MVGGTPERRCGAVLFIAHVPAVVLSVTQPGQWDANLVGTLEKAGLTGDRRARVVFVRSVVTVFPAITLPVAGYAETVSLALKLVTVAEARTSSRWRRRRHFKMTENVFKLIIIESR